MKYLLTILVLAVSLNPAVTANPNSGLGTSVYKV